MLHAHASADPDSAVDAGSSLAAAPVETAADARAAARLRAIAEATAPLTWATDPDGALVDPAPTWERFTGQDAREAAGTGWLAAVHPDDRAPLRAEWALAHTRATPEPVVVRVRRHDGAWRIVAVQVAPVRDAAGVTRELVAAARDATERHAADAALRASESRLRLMADAAPIGVIVADASREIHYVNAAAAAILGATIPEVTLARWRAAVHADDLERVVADSVALFAGAEEEHVTEYRLWRADGALRRIRALGRSVRGADGAVASVVAVLADVTDARRAEAELRASEERFRALGACSPVGILLADAEGRLTYANPRLQEILGAPEPALLGEGWRAALHPDDADGLRADWRALHDASAPIERECRVLRDGAMRWALVRLAPLRDAAGARIGVVGTLEDVTAARAASLAASRALAAADLDRRRLQAVLDALPVGVIVADADGAIVHFSDPLARIMRGSWAAGSTGEYGDYRAWWTDTGRPLAGGDWGLARALRDGETSLGERIEIERFDGTRASILNSAAPVRDAEGRIVGAVAAVLDVSEQRQLEARLRQAQKLEAVGQLAGGVAHDFNNLLTVITGNLEFVRADLEPTHAVQRDLAEIARAADRARGVVRQLLAFGQRQTLRPQPLALDALVAGTVHLLRRLLGDEIALETQLSTAPATVHADPGQLEQVLLNLALNARDAMLGRAHGHHGRGGTLALATDRVTLDAQEAAGWAPLAPGAYVRLRVRDTGHGMDRATLARVFEPFFTTKPVGEGNGLGLATAFGIVTQSGGAIRAESTPGEGATFTVLLPEAPDAADDVPRAAPPPHGTGPGSGTVLLVEDEPPVRATTRRMLERHGYRVLEARHGAHALELWEAHGARVAAVVTDLRMPQLGGVELVARLRERAAELPVVFVGGSVEVRDVAPGRYDRVLAKPFAVQALLAALGELLVGADAKS